MSVAENIGCRSETLRKWVRAAERQQIPEQQALDAECERVKALERENRELRQGNEILRKPAAFFGPGGARPPTQVMVAFIDQHRDSFGVESICKQPPFAPSAYYEQKAGQRDPALIPARQRRDAVLREEVKRVYQASRCRYGARKVWLQLAREGIPVARCTV